MTTPVTDAPGAQPPATEPPAPQQPPVPQPPAQVTPPAAADPAQAGNADELPSWAQREFKRLRDENGTNRVKAKEATDAAAAEIAKFRAEQEAQRLAMGKALGLVADEAPTPEQLAARLNAAQAETQAERDRARATAVELAVFRASAAAQVNGNALLDSRSFTATLTGLDPAAPDFAQRVSAAITAAVEVNPGWKLAAPAPAAPPAPAPPAVPRSGTGPVTGVPDGPRQLTDADIARMSPSEVQKAMDDGLLQGLGFGTARKQRR